MAAFERPQGAKSPIIFGGSEWRGGDATHIWVHRYLCAISWNDVVGTRDRFNRFGACLISFGEATADQRKKRAGDTHTTDKTFDDYFYMDREDTRREGKE